MKTVHELLSELRRLQIKLWLEGDKLCYQAPSGALNPELRQQVKQHKPEIISLLQNAQTNRVVKEDSIPLIPRKDGQTFPLSFSQQRLWFLSQFEGTGATYNMPVALKLEGNLNQSALIKSFNELVQRHEILRTRFILENEHPVQVIDRDIILHFPVLDLEGINQEEQNKQIEKYIEEENHYHFQLDQEHLIKVTLLKLKQTCHILLVNIHHIIGDGWSGGRLVEELSQLYEAFCQDKSSPLPNLTVQYADYAVWQREWIEANEGKKQGQYWQKTLNNSPALINLPTDYPRPKVQSFKGKTYQIDLPLSLINSLKELSQQQGVTLFVTLLTALKIVLFKWTHQEDLVVGTVIAGRNRVEIEPLIGCFMNFLALRSQLTEETTINQLLQQENKIVLDAYSNQDFPFEKVVEIINPERNTSHNPIYNVGLLLQNFAKPPLFGDKLTVTSIENDADIALLDLRWVITEESNKIVLDCEYSTSLFREETIEYLVKSYVKVLETVIQNREIKVKNLKLLPNLQQQAEKAKLREYKQTIAIAASFTAEPIEAILSYWMEKLSWSSQIQLAAYNQVFQELLNPNSLINQNHQGINIILIRLEDWVRFTENQQSSESLTDKIRQNVNEIISAIQQTQQLRQSPLILALCPSSPTFVANQASFLTQMEILMVSQLKNLHRVHLICLEDIRKTYAVSDYYDANRDELGHIPYTEVFYAALGTAIARKIYALKQSPYKVIALDCDNTLWGGVCGEDGATGVIIDEPRKILQQFIVEQQKIGKLICLCSKNQEEDVWSVFEAHPEMPLKQDHLVAWKINWQSKSDNLRTLAKELNLGLDSFILIDDNPVECAEVRANCPEVLTLQLPEISQKIPEFLNHIWAFDSAQTTDEDKKRTELYRQNLAREELQQKSSTFTDFLAGLNLSISFEPINQDNLSRVAQLTQRTNQFNLTTIRRNEAEIEDLLKAQQLEGQAIKVNDRFGDYGLVGVVLFSYDETVLTIDTFLLSCRVLGRGVEYEMLKYLGNLAQQKNLSYVNAPYYVSAKNKPVLDFLETISQGHKHPIEGGWMFKFPIELIMKTKFNPTQTVSSSSLTASSELNLVVQAPWQLLNEIATELINPLDIVQEVAAKQQQNRSEHLGEFVEPRNEIEEQLVTIWQEVLKVDRVGITDNFFDIGGNSLLATQVISRMRNAFGLELPLYSLFEHPTIIQINEYMAKTRSTLTKLTPNSTLRTDQLDDDVEEFDL
ncbi:FkbH like protein [Rippkaea orientalis PCC 8801]|uniref:FkbH like protein n=1 Tax=Rippkaea orientalis (strain PCC 8801 / RF-1) TaxID=41431 RepID=B7K2U3_RIPO1|nr:HAD-IIIC family phosphatase [Rippkaea orientalis]ACK67644.1 FkbH like protein [Rippkaea orientalis PCC 8801]